MQKENGIIKIKKTKNSLKARIISSGKSYDIPNSFKHELSEELNDKDCQFVLESGQLKQLFIEGKEYLPKEIKKSKKNISNGGKKKKDAASKKEKSQSKQKNNFSKNMFDITRTPLPNYVKNIGLTDIDNFYLKYYKAPLIKNTEANETKLEFNNIKSHKHTNFFSNKIIEEQKKSAEVLFYQSEYKNLEKTLTDKLTIGLGIDSPYEAGINLHHIYGVPFIPGQALKGILRSYILQELFHEKEDDDPEAKAIKEDKLFVWLFGSSSDNTESAGNVTFFDAYPANFSNENIDMDIMTPHYSPYYNDPDKNPPADYYNPIPIPFVVVKDCTFNFIFGIKRKPNPTVMSNSKLNTNNFKDIIKLIESWFNKALTEHGIGAKTSVGYGIFE